MIAILRELGFSGFSLPNKLQKMCFLGLSSLKKSSSGTIVHTLVAQWLALLTSELEGPGSNPCSISVRWLFLSLFVKYVLCLWSMCLQSQSAIRPLMMCTASFWLLQKVFYGLGFLTGWWVFLKVSEYLFSMIISHFINTHGKNQEYHPWM
jgi:hypothetical protein